MSLRLGICAPSLSVVARAVSCVYRADNCDQVLLPITLLHRRRTTTTTASSEVNVAGRHVIARQGEKTVWGAQAKGVSPLFGRLARRVIGEVVDR